MTKKIYQNGIQESSSGILTDDKQAKLRSRNPAQLAFVRNLGLLFVLSSVPKNKLSEAGISGPYATPAEVEEEMKELEEEKKDESSSEVKLETAQPEDEPAAPAADIEAPAVPPVAVSDSQPKAKGLARFKKAGQQVIQQTRVVKAFKVPLLEDAPAPKSWPSRIFYVISFPLMILFRFTVLDCRKEKFKKLFPITFIICICYIAVFCHFMVSWSTYIGCFLSIPDAIMGLTLLACGASMPEVFSCAAVARQGLGDMAIANSLGSNVFDNLIGLGFTWFVFGLARGSVAVDSTGIYVYIGIVIFSMIFTYVLFMIQRFRLTRVTAIILIIYYCIFIVFGCLFSFPGSSPVIDLSKIPSSKFPNLGQ